MISARLEGSISLAEWDLKQAEILSDPCAWLDANERLEELRMNRLRMADERAADALASEM